MRVNICPPPGGWRTGAVSTGIRSICGRERRSTPCFWRRISSFFGDDLRAIIVTQTALSLVLIVLIYALARTLVPPELKAAPTLAAALAGISMPFAVYPQLFLSETLYITLVSGGILALVAVRPGNARSLSETPPSNQAGRTLPPRRGLIIAGALFGLATLTRSQTLLFLPVIAGWLAYTGRHALRHALLQTLLFLSIAALVIAPWTVYNSRIYGGLILVDTSGAFNLLLGAWSAHDGTRRDAPTRDFVLAMFPNRRVTAPADTCLPHPGVQPDQAARQAAMVREGLCLILDRPLAFVHKSLVEFIDLFRINYTGAERLTDGFSTGRLPVWYVALLFLLDDTLYVLALLPGVIGWAVVRRLSPTPGAVALIGLWLIFNIALAPLLFAINRFRMPLLPFLFILAAVTITMLLRNRACLYDVLRTRYGIACGALAGLLTLVAAAPYAYLEPRPHGSDSQWASYLGPYPSSLAITGIAQLRHARAPWTMRASWRRCKPAMSPLPKRSCTTARLDATPLGWALH
jgi:hypothetical protein